MRENVEEVFRNFLSSYPLHFVYLCVTLWLKIKIEQKGRVMRILLSGELA
jgi:hypothetical protein